MGAYGSPELSPKPPQKYTSESNLKPYKVQMDISSESLIHKILWFIIIASLIGLYVSLFLAYSAIARYFLR